MIRVEDKMDFLVNEWLSFKTEQRDACREHKSWTAKVQTEVADLKTFRIYTSGAAAVIVSFILYMREEIKRKFLGGHP